MERRRPLAPAPVGAHAGPRAVKDSRTSEEAALAPTNPLVRGTGKPGGVATRFRGSSVCQRTRPPPGANLGIRGWLFLDKVPGRRVPVIEGLTGSVRKYLRGVPVLRRRDGQVEEESYRHVVGVLVSGGEGGGSRIISVCPHTGCIHVYFALCRDVDALADMMILSPVYIMCSSRAKLPFRFYSCDMTVMTKLTRNTIRPPPTPENNTHNTHGS